MIEPFPLQENQKFARKEFKTDHNCHKTNKNVFVKEHVGCIEGRNEYPPPPPQHISNTQTVYIQYEVVALHTLLSRAAASGCLADTMARWTPSYVLAAVFSGIAVRVRETKMHRQGERGERDGNTCDTYPNTKYRGELWPASSI